MMMRVKVAAFFALAGLFSGNQAFSNQDLNSQEKGHPDKKETEKPASENANDIAIEKQPAIAPALQGVKPKLVPIPRPTIPNTTPKPNIPNTPPSPVVKAPASEAIAELTDFIRERTVVCIPGGTMAVTFDDRMTRGLPVNDGRIVEAFGAEIDITRRNEEGLAPGKCAFYDGFPPWMRESYRYLDGVYYRDEPLALGIADNQNLLPKLTINPPARGGLMIDDGEIQPGRLTIGIINGLGNPQRTAPVYLKVKPAKCDEITLCRTERLHGASTTRFFVTKISDTPFTD